MVRFQWRRIIASLVCLNCICGPILTSLRADDNTASNRIYFHGVYCNTTVHSVLHTSGAGTIFGQGGQDRDRQNRERETEVYK